MNDTTKILDLAYEAGSILLENGAEISRVEETMRRIACHYGVEGEDFFVVLRHAPQGKVREIARAKLPKGVREVYLKATGDFTRLPGADFRGNPAGSDLGRFFYSADGQTWLPIGRSIGLVYTIPHFTGYRFALFMYSTKVTGGYADFDYLRLD